jgi:hypothetical protein
MPGLKEWPSPGHNLQPFEVRTVALHWQAHIQSSMGLKGNLKIHSGFAQALGATYLIAACARIHWATALKHAKPGLLLPLRQCIQRLPRKSG